MKTFRQFITEARLKPEHEKKMVDWADNHYQGVAHDLHASVNTRMGDSHYHAAHDYMADRLSDEFRKEHPNANFRAIAKKALKGYGLDDRKEARAAGKKYEREYNKNWRVQNQPPKPRKSQKPKPVKIKARRGIGSY